VHRGLASSIVVLVEVIVLEIVLEFPDHQLVLHADDTL
jgi:hypothetical protein